ncbi:MAG: hypothetical protein RMK80_06810, partial [Pseudobdellovibrionaceae bacterium]|nr:hypothetical protein [Pseudobdellovibrionaceae bacterium]
KVLLSSVHSLFLSFSLFFSLFLSFSLFLFQEMILFLIDKARMILILVSVYHECEWIPTMGCV